jgi:hypothetical protein
VEQAVIWDNGLQKWLLLPRKGSLASAGQIYNAVADERLGTNLLLVASEDFQDIQVLVD